MIDDIFETHEWHKLDGGIVTIGITQVAADELTDITFVALPKVGDKCRPTRAGRDRIRPRPPPTCIAAYRGPLPRSNSELTHKPELVNKDPFNAGWMIRVKASQPEEATKLLSADDYLKKTGH